MGLFLTLIFNYWVVVNLSESEVGIFFFFNTLVVVLATLGRVGTDSLIVTQISSCDDLLSRRGEFSKFIVLVLISSGVIVVSGFLIMFGWPSYWKHYFWFDSVIYCLVITPILAASIAYSEYAKAEGRAVWSISCRFVLAPLLLCISFLFFSPTSSIELMDVYVCSVALVLFAQVIDRRGSVVLDCRGFFRALAARLKKGAPILLVACCGLIVGWVDLILLGFYVSAGDVALYGAAAKVAGLFALIGTTAQTVFSPLLSRAVASSEYRKFGALYRQVIGLSFCAAAILLTAVIIFGVRFLELLGHAYVEGYWVLLFLAVAQAINVSFGPVGFVMVLINKSGSYAIYYIAICCLSILSYPLMIYWCGIEGAGLIAIAAMLSINVVCLLQVRQWFGLLAKSH